MIDLLQMARVLQINLNAIRYFTAPRSLAK